MVYELGLHWHIKSRFGIYKLCYGIELSYGKMVQRDDFVGV